MSEASPAIRVRLKHDLTRYHASLQAGAEGTTVPPVGLWARSSDRFCSVRFPEVVMDVLWSALEVVDPEVIRMEVEHREERDAGVRERPVSAMKTLGPRGGFRRLVVTYRNLAGEEVVVIVTERAEAVYLEGLLAAAHFPVGVKTELPRQSW